MEADRVWVIFDWDEQGFKNYLSDPEVPAIIKEAGHVGKPQPAERQVQRLTTIGLGVIQEAALFIAHRLALSMSLRVIFEPTKWLRQFVRKQTSGPLAFTSARPNAAIARR
jgi:hypothetical protein